jgi:DNA invertase Pin-like site-specific DNA recombinase
MPRTAISYTRFSSPRQALGHSEERQVESAREYAKEKGFVLKEVVDRGLSGYTGRNVSEGALGALIKQVKAGALPKNLILLVEDPDRISRETWAKAYPKVYQPLSEAGIEIHFLSFRGVLRPEHSFTDLLQIGIKHDQGNLESEKKSERCGESWKKKRYNANGKAAMSSRVPAWLKAQKGKPIELRSERAGIVRQIFDWAAQGIGQYAITDRLIRARVPPWGPKRLGVPPRWTPAYVRDILASRAVLGEYQPMSKWTIRTDDEGNAVRFKLKQRQPDGPLVTDYYPQIIPHSLWADVQKARQDFAKAKFGESLHSGRNKFSTANLFRKMVWDVQNNAPMVFRDYLGHPCLVTTHRKDLRQNKISYPLFEEVILRFLKSADWKELAKDDLGPEAQKLLLGREKLAKELDGALKIRSRYEALLDDPETATDDRINEKYKAASKEARRAQEACSALEAEISASRSGSALIAETKGIEITRTDRSSVEGRTKLRLFLAQRIERIEVTFRVEIITAPSQTVPGIESGKGRILIRIIFKNGAHKLAILNGKKLARLELGAYKQL